NDVTEQALVVNPTSVTVPENGTATFQVSLAVAESTSRTVTVSLGSGDPDITIQSGSTLTFPANTTGPQTVTLAAAEDSDSTNGARTIIVSSSGLASVNVTATEQDNDIADQALVVNPTSVAVPEGGTNTFAVSLAGQPQSNVVVTSPAGSGDTDITIQSGATLTFTPTNWNVTQNVTLAAAEDADATNGSRTITVSSSGLESVTVTATEIDNDGAENPYIEEFLEQ